MCCRPKPPVCPTGCKTTCPTGPTGESGQKGDPGNTGPAGNTGAPFPPIAILPGGDFGNGGDGNLDLCMNPNSLPNPLDRDYYFNNLTVCGTLCTGGYRIFVRDTLTLGDGAVICNKGESCLSCRGVGAPLGTCGRGTNGGFALVGFRGPGENANAPTAGGMGGAGAYPGGNLYPLLPMAGQITLITPPSPPACPPGSQPPNPSNAVGIWSQFPFNTQGRDLNANQIWGGTGGGGDIGAGGGGGGGVIIISALNVVAKGNGIAIAKITVKGGDGSTNGNTGGGGGGSIVFNYGYLSSNLCLTFDVSGGAGNGTGSPGGNGTLFVVPVLVPVPTGV